MKKKGTFSLALLVAVFLVVGWFFYREPYRTYDALKTAAAENDNLQFRNLVDESAVQKALIQDLRAAVDETVGPIPENTYTRLAKSLADRLFAQLVAPITTPDGLHQLLTQGELDPAFYGASLPASAENDDDLLDSPSTDQPTPSTGGGKGNASVLTEQAGYDALNHFKVKLEAEGRVKPVILTFERKNIWSWHLVRVTFGV